MSEITDADRLAYNNLPTITLKNERKLELHYGFGGLRRIEASFGSLSAFMEDCAKEDKGAIFDTLLRGLHCGLWKQKVTEEELEDLLDPARVEEYAGALGRALELSFPKVPKNEDEGEDGQNPTSPSIGPDTPTSPQPSSDSASPTSGT